jgi:hypothetical protein
MERKNVLEVRVYTGSGYEDFVVGQVVKHDHIFNKSNFRKQITVREIFVGENYVHVVFDECLGFVYEGLKYRTAYEYVI